MVLVEVVEFLLGLPVLLPTVSLNGPTDLPLPDSLVPAIKLLVPSPSYGHQPLYPDNMWLLYQHGSVR